jgi:hypothetical protein
MSVAKIRRELEMLNRVFAPQKEVRMGIDFNKLTALQKKTIMDAGRLYNRDAEEQHFTESQMKLIKEANEIWEKYQEPESVIRARQPPIH